jgi:hypothetical protein
MTSVAVFGAQAVSIGSTGTKTERRKKRIEIEIED